MNIQSIIDALLKDFERAHSELAHFADYTVADFEDIASVQDAQQVVRHIEVLERVVRAVAKTTPMIASDPWHKSRCLFCDGKEREHDDDCPWLMAQGLVEDGE